VIRKALAVMATTLGLLLTMSGSPAHAGAICSAMDSNLHADCPGDALPAVADPAQRPRRQRPVLVLAGIWQEPCGSVPPSRCG
jgi:hypothetical protein